ncbi:hypothetical protein [Oceanibium sediminis]|uniref:hypothetical protein n=1 Tax=Oceanibium sediminis TaxID=2026339 RepID=UPI00130016F3|nr:hypothetical protein [Oceanibium sediminis]
MRRTRETAMVEPEPYYEPREKSGALMPLIFGLIVGFAGLAVYLGAPEALGQLHAMYNERLAALGEEWRQYATYIAIAIGLLFLLIVRRIVLRIPLILGLILGALIWVPFGNHIMAAVPVVEENLPALRGELDTVLNQYPALQSLRDIAEDTIAVPGAQPAE